MTQAQLKKLSEFLAYLYERWQDEKEYEPFEDYLAAFQKQLPPRARIVSFTHDPSFKAVFRLVDENKNRYVKVTPRKGELEIEWGTHT